MVWKDWMDNMIKKIIYALSILCLVILTIITKDMLPLIFRTKYAGIMFLVFIVLMLISELYALLKYKKALKKNISYNLFVVLATMYVVIVYYRIYSFDANVLYNFDLKYLRFNYIVLSVALIMIMVDLYLGIKDYKQKVEG